MMKDEVFEERSNQAINLPKEHRTGKWAKFQQSFAMFSENYMQEGRIDNITQEQE